jgi:hypothetical protein
VSAHAADSGADPFAAVLGTRRGLRDRLPDADDSVPEVAQLPKPLTAALLASAHHYVATIEASGSAGSSTKGASIVDSFEFDLTGDGAYLTVIYSLFKQGQRIEAVTVGVQVFISSDGSLDGERTLDFEELQTKLRHRQRQPLSGPNSPRPVTDPQSAWPPAQGPQGAQGPMPMPGLLRR